MKYEIKILIAAVAVLSILMVGTVAAEPGQKTVSVSYEDTPLEVALRRLQEESGFRISYRPSLLSNAKPVTMAFSNAQPMAVVDELLKTCGLVAISTREASVAVAPSTSRIGRYKRFGQALRKIDSLLVKRTESSSTWTTDDGRALSIAILDVWVCVSIERLDGVKSTEKWVNGHDKDVAMSASVMPGLRAVPYPQEKAQPIPTAGKPALKFVEMLSGADWNTVEPAELRAKAFGSNHALPPHHFAKDVSTSAITKRIREVSKTGDAASHTLMLAKLAQIVPKFANELGESKEIRGYVAASFADPDLAKQAIAGRILYHIQSPESLLELMDKNPTCPAGRLMICGYLFRNFSNLTTEQKDLVYNWVMAQKEPSLKRALWQRAGDLDYRNVRVVGYAPYQTDFTVQDVAFSQDSKMLALGGHGGLSVWDLETGKRKLSIPVKNTVYGLEFLDNDTKLMIQHESNRSNGGYAFIDGGPPIIIWDLKEGRQVVAGHLPESPTLPQSLADRIMGDSPRIDHDKEWWSGRHFAVSPLVKAGSRQSGQVILAPGGYSDYGPHILAWDLNTGKLVKGIMNAARTATSNQTFRVKVMSFSPDGTRLFCLDESKGRGKNSFNQCSVWTWPGRKRLHAWMSPVNHYSFGPMVSWLPDNKRIIISSSEKAYLYEAGTGEILREFRGAGRLDSSGKKLILIDPDSSAVLIQNTENWEVESTVRVDGLDKNLWFRMRISPDGRWLASDINRRSCLLVDLLRRELVSPNRNAHTGMPRTQYAADGRLIVFDSGKVRIYDSDTWRTQKTLPAWSGSVGPKGRLLLTSSGGRQSEIWDSVQGRMLDTLAQSRGYLKFKTISDDGRWCAIMKERSTQLQFHDLITNRPMKSFTDENKKYKKYANPWKIVWDSSGRAFVADGSGAIVRAFDNDRPLGLNPIGFTGCLNPVTGEVVYRFKTPEGRIVETANDIALSEKVGLVYLNGVVTAYKPYPGESSGFSLVKTPVHGVWNVRDGSFVRAIQWPKTPLGEPHNNWPAKFTADGKWLVSPGSIVDVKTGRVVNRYPKGSVSPSGSLVATIRQNRVYILDALTGREVWQASLDRDLNEELAPSHRVFWHPDETQLTIGFKKHPALLVVDLFKSPDIDVPADPQTLGVTIRQLGDSDINIRKRAVYALVQLDSKNTSQIAEFLDKNEVTPDQRRLIHLVLEWKAREGDRTAYEILQKQSTGAGIDATVAGFAIERLAAGERARALAEEYANPKPFPWAASEQAIKERQDQVARFDEDGDGRLSDQEARRGAEAMLRSIEAKGLTGKWKQFDLNKNGFLDQGERDQVLGDLIQNLTH